jgi:hypothetical protein
VQPGDPVLGLPPLGPEYRTTVHSWTFSFNLNLRGQDRLPVGVQPGNEVVDLTPRPYEHHVQLRSWTWPYNLNLLLGKDRLPAGEQVFDRPTIDQFQTTRSWTWSYGLSLIGKDRLPVGEAVTELSPRGPDYRSQILSWTWTSFPYYPPGLPPGVMPGEPTFDTPRAAQQPAISWTRSSFPYYPPTVTQLPPGEQVFDLAPRGPVQPTISWTFVALPQVSVDTTNKPVTVLDWGDPPIAGRLPDGFIAPFNLPLNAAPVQRPKNQYDWPVNLGQVQPAVSWTWSYNLNLVGQDKQPVGKTSNEVPRAYEYHVQLRAWNWSYNLNLIGKDRLPVGAEVSDRTPVGPAPLLLTWVSSLNSNLFFPPIVPPRPPFNVFDWPLTPAPVREANLGTWIETPQLTVPSRQLDWPNPIRSVPPAQTWTNSYTLGLLGQDKLPTGDQLTDLPPRNFVYGYGQTWIGRFSLPVFQSLPVGEQSTDLPPRPALQPVQVFTKGFELWRFEQMPPGEQATDLPPRPYAPPGPTWIKSYDLTLIGQDQLPTGEQLSDLPPRDYDRALWLRTWINAVNVALITGAQQQPKNQYDWPVPPAPQQPIQIFTASFPLSLIGQDQLPPGEQSTDLTGRYPPQIQLNSWQSSYNLNLIGKDAMPVGDISTALPAAALLTPADLRSIFIQGAPYIPPFVPPPPGAAQYFPYIANPGTLMQRS